MTAQNILITGDFILDNHIYEGQRNDYGDATSLGVHLCRQLGGAALVHQIVEQLILPNKKEKKAQARWRSISAVKDPSRAMLAQISPPEQAYAYWQPFAEDAKKKPVQLVWRVRRAMGFGQGKEPSQLQPANVFQGAPNIVVVSEGGMGFRDCVENWPEKAMEQARWIVLKTTAPVAQGPLWEYLTQNYAGKLIVIVSAHELRKSFSARISTGLSWEETVEGLFRELRPQGTLYALTQCRHLVVSLESEGALWLNLPKELSFDKAEACLVYAASAIEGESAHNIEGISFGFLSCLTAAVTWALTQNFDDPHLSNNPDLAMALARGLAAMKDLREQGHGPVTDQPASGFPAKRLAGVIRKTTLRYSQAWFLAKD